VRELGEMMETNQEMSDNLNWLTTQNRNLLARLQQLEGILNAVQEQSPEALSFLQEAQTRQEMGDQVRDGEELTDEGEEEKEDTKEENSE
jgi:predicted nuclease with TOPRIM domain|tara:strand:- start:1811 stop:2080 length:270 start_codon:yes stop_codon:yes gene_type:complete